MSNLSPIVLFVYNRLEHTKKTINALKKNLLAEQSHLYIYSDGYKNEEDKTQVLELRKYLKTIKGFLDISIIEQNKNKGLANSIISGVTEVINHHGTTIVVEDDIVTSRYFLTFMNKALNDYKEEKKVWHISGWNYPISNEYLEDTFLWRMMNCWGWATWEDRWKYFEKEPKKLINTYSKKDINKFDLDINNAGFWEQVLKNSSREMNTWAIFWYATIFNNKGLCLNPTQSFTKNIGFDGTGTNTGFRNNYSSKLNNSSEIRMTKNFNENKLALERIKRFLIKKDDKNLQFSKSLNLIYKKLNELKNTKEKYILYGAGTGCLLTLGILKENITFIVDNNLSNKEIYNIEVKNLSFLETTNHKIIITPFGRFYEIYETLTKQYKIPKDRIISLDIL
ncbi:glycosyltransferase family protein [Halarcobacter mediterraneus]|uniref:hypothetical protein n=1 Tax=Halarcobacter mediterraneus TaxID=2023153 RepID=UPI0019D6BA68|nr:hypothetical protein [Halarcobacter mediterraneus]